MMTRYTFRATTDEVVKVMSAGLLVLASAVIFPAFALASHYGIDSTGLVDDAKVVVLASAGIDTTADLLQKTATAKDVKALARKAGVSVAQVGAWRDFCDLLRLDGVGPKVARAMTLAGAANLKELVKFSPEVMAGKIKDVNKTQSILGKLPDAENLTAWIDQAKLLLKQDKKQGQKPAKTGGRK